MRQREGPAMKIKSSMGAFGVSLAAAFAFSTPLLYAAKPADKGGGGSTAEETIAVAPPEFYWSTLDPINRILTVRGKDLVTGDAGSPVFPELFIGGQLVAIDETASATTTDFATNEGSLVVTFSSILDALAVPVPAPDLRTLTGGDNWEIRVVTSTGTAFSSAYFPRTIKDLPPDTGTCPCATEFSAYDKVDVAPDATFCSATQGISTDEYMEAGYGKLDGSAVIIGSHRSWSSESLYSSTCYARDLSQVVNGVEQPQYLGASPIPVGDNDHQICVTLIKNLEAACGP